jgi:hypothetical protein
MGDQTETWSQVCQQGRHHACEGHDAIGGCHCPDTSHAAAEPRPTPLRLTPSAASYLGELQSAAQLVQVRREEAELAERASWLHIPAGVGRRADNLQGAALNSPLMHVDQYKYVRLMAAARAAKQDVGRVAWWYATAALAALDAVLAGQEITARQLEVLTLSRPGRDAEVEDDAPPWAACFRPHLPGDGELRTGVERLDTAMDQALAPLRAAYNAAGICEDYYRGMDEPADDDGDDGAGTGLAEHEHAALADAERQVFQIPNLLIDYATAVEAAAHAAYRLCRT